VCVCVRGGGGWVVAQRSIGKLLQPGMLTSWAVLQALTLYGSGGFDFFPEVLAIS
jgi:hypothetical protein